MAVRVLSVVEGEGEKKRIAQEVILQVLQAVILSARCV